MPISSHWGWLPRTRATASATAWGESTGTSDISAPVAGLRTWIGSAADGTAPLAVPFVFVPVSAVPLSTGAPFVDFGCAAKTNPNRGSAPGDVRLFAPRAALRLRLPNFDDFARVG